MRSFTRRQFVATAAATSLGVKSLRGGHGGGRRRSDRPNVLILQPDQHRGTIMGCAGDETVRTPNLDQLGADGVRFTNCVSNHPVCSPFRGIMQSGLYCWQHGVVHNNIRMAPDLTCIAELFEAEGYATGYIGKWHLDGGWPEHNKFGKGGGPYLGYVPPKRRQGYQEWHGYEKSHIYTPVYRQTKNGPQLVEDFNWEPQWHTQKALDFIDDNESENRRWMYYVAYGPPHLPDQCPDRYMELYPPESFKLPPDVQATLPDERRAELRKILQYYYAQVTGVDAAIGRLLDGLEDIGAADNTIVIYTSDHGDRLGSHVGGPHSAAKQLRGKSRPFLSAMAIPLIVRWPDEIDAGRVCDTLTSAIDLAPTVCDLAGIEVPSQMEGHSMADWCLTGEGTVNEAVALGVGHNLPSPRHSIRPRIRKKLEPGEDWGGGWWRAAYDGRYVYCPRGFGDLGPTVLFDHRQDPYEMNNMGDSDDVTEIKRRLADVMLEFSGATNDPVIDDLRRQLRDDGAIE